MVCCSVEARVYCYSSVYDGFLFRQIACLPQKYSYMRFLFSPAALAEALQIPKLTLPRLLLRSKQNTLVHKILIMYNINDTRDEKTDRKQNQWLQVRDRPDISIKYKNIRIHNDEDLMRLQIIP